MKEYNFIDNSGTFKIDDPQKVSYTYFPLCNYNGMMGAITPTLNGDIKIDQNHFALLPVSQEDLHNSNAGRNIWLNIDGYGPWSVSGVSAKQTVDNEDKVTLEAGLLWHKLIRENKKNNILAETVTYVPVSDDNIELTKVTLVNKGDKQVSISPTIAVPIFGRSADNLRDHRHVTALLNRVNVVENGIINTPSLSFDERGHNKNDVSYGVIAKDGKGNQPTRFYPVLETFIGEGGSLDWPEAIVSSVDSTYKVGDTVDGYEAMGGLGFERVVIEPGESYSMVFGIYIDEQNKGLDYYNSLCSVEAFNEKLEENKAYWAEQLATLSFNTGDAKTNNWLKWTTLQPILRRIYGCSFLPHHDYGRGGRGWRDLWQDCLALILMDPEKVRYLLYNNFAGIRVDGSNATIIGSKPGEFLADRNNIVRVWMDHGAWPLITTQLYINNSGDLDFLLEEQNYFKDQHVSYARENDLAWQEVDGNQQKDENDTLYKGSILEHLLIQNLVPFFNVGSHNNIRLEGADWNDGLDMASKNGESVAFTALYGANLKEIANLLEALRDRKGLKTVTLLEEIVELIDSNKDMSYDSIEEKLAALNKYFNRCKHSVSGNKVDIKIDDLVEDLHRKSDWIFSHIRENEWIEQSDSLGWFNGYYDNASKPLERAADDDIRMTLTGQVFAIMSGVASDEQVEKIVHAADTYLRDDSVGGYRLNNNFNEVKLDMGRLFGFAFGHKENGAMFSHMAMMYANGLYKRGFVKEGHQVMDGIFKHCMDFEKSKIYPGIPEYIDIKGRGMYNYLTGSASWLILNMVTEVFGIKGNFGDLLIQPKLVKDQFSEDGKASITALFADKIWNISFENKELLDANEYCIKSVKINDKVIECEIDANRCLILREQLPEGDANEIQVILG